MKNIFTKLFFLVALFIMSTTILCAKTINVDEAKDLAHQFLTSNLKCNTPENMKRVSPKASLTLAYEAKAQNGKSNLFVFNQGEKGFVIVAGDDCVSPILGYADAGAFDEGNMPEGFRYWLESCSRYMEKAVAGEVKREDMTMMKSQSRSYAAYVNPLLGDIAFHQHEPYNGQCPMIDGERTIVGCVAISMGQIMTYYQWPKQGQGSYSYITTDGLDVSADFNTTYDWDNILHYYDDNYTRQQSNAVAKMLFHCGVSVNMNYGVDGSGSTDIYVPKALSEYFGYDRGMQLHYRAMYNFNDWKNLIKEELNNNRPIIYCGDSDEGGHAFNCDGYDSNDYFHINWGWGGYYNGYYDLRYLDYEDNDQTAFNRGHSIVTGIKPDKGDGTETQTELAHNLVLYSGTTVVRGNGGEDTLVCSFWNYGPGVFYGDMALEVCDAWGDRYDLNILAEDFNLDPFYGLWDFRIAVLDNYEYEGYSVRLLYRNSNERTWKPIPAEKGMIATFVYDADSDSWTEKADEVPMFRLNYLSPIGELNDSEALRFEVSITSLNDFDYDGDLLVRIWDDEIGVISQGFKSIFILAGETNTFTVTFDELVEAGEYNVYAAVDQKNGYLSLIYDENGNLLFPITIGEGSGSASKPNLSMSYAYLNKTEFNVGDYIEYNASIVNNGGDAETYILTSYHKKNSDGSYEMLHYTEAHYFYISENHTSSANIGYTIPSDFTSGEYSVTMWYYDSWSAVESQWVEFTPYDVSELFFTIKGNEQQQDLFEIVSDMRLNKTTFSPGETIGATYTIRNNGDGRYLNLGIAIADLYENQSYTNLANTTQVYFPGYSDREITSTVVVPSDLEYGEYRVFAYYYNDWDGTGYYFFIPIEYNAKHIFVEEGKPQQPILEMVAPMQLNKTAFYPGETLEATFSLRNNGAAGSVNVGLTLNDGYGLWHPELGADLQSIYLSENSTKNLNFSITIPRDYVAGNYSVFAYYEQDGNYYGIESVENSIAYITIEEFDGKYDITVTAKDKNGETLGSGRYDYGSEVTIAAIPDYGYKFYRWSDKNKENPRVVTVEGEATYEAEFRTITISLEAQPNDDAFEFVEWSDGVTDNPRSISIAEESELKYVAIFRMKETAIENAYITSAHVYANSGYLYVVGAEDDYLVFDEVGKLIYSGNETSIQLPSGVYLVRLGKEVQKVVVL